VTAKEPWKILLLRRGDRWHGRPEFAPSHRHESASDGRASAMTDGSRGMVHGGIKVTGIGMPQLQRSQCA
jgi:hypothetical protein